MSWQTRLGEDGGVLKWDMEELGRFERYQDVAGNLGSISNLSTF